MTLVAGVDSSTQSCKVVVRDAATGELVRKGVGPAPRCRPRSTRENWWNGPADCACERPGASTVSPRSRSPRNSTAWSASTRTGRSYVRRSCGTTRDRLLQAEALVSELGAEAWAHAVGSVPLAAFTVSKLRWLAEHEPEQCEAAPRPSAFRTTGSPGGSWALSTKSGLDDRVADHRSERRERHGLLVRHHR